MCFFRWQDAIDGGCGYLIALPAQLFTEISALKEDLHAYPLTST